MFQEICHGNRVSRLTLFTYYS